METTENYEKIELYDKIKNEEEFTRELDKIIEWQGEELTESAKIIESYYN